jgi:hypothetical protein
MREKEWICACFGLSTEAKKSLPREEEVYTDPDLILSEPRAIPGLAVSVLNAKFVSEVRDGNTGPSTPLKSASLSDRFL